ncbi:hypothetical protein [Azospirillum canadense]|uniref:hypothetical protein n=1 Tax=Azospirillum canadense TaxID=403962 RepID=UPI002225E46B|nr:hypothetical protein [Azospirillum canadense]MCW2239262.1 hypothetical protein [Azospirillum canadense]
MPRPFPVFALILIGALHGTPAASQPPLDVSLAQLCDGPAGTAIKDMASDRTAGFVVEVLLIDAANRVVEQVPFVALPGMTVTSQAIQKRDVSVDGKDGVVMVPVCAGSAIGVRLTPQAAGHAVVELVIEASALKRQDVGSDQRRPTKAPEPEIVRIEEALRMKEGERLDLKVGGNGPVRRVGVTYGRTR